MTGATQPERAPGPVGHPTGSDTTVVVCAYTMDRWDDVVAALGGLAEQRVRPGEIVLVIDHHDELLRRSTSEFGTAAVVVPNDRARGLSGARNTGIARATGSVVAFLDDDARPEPEWLARLLAAYDDPAVQAVGGSATPVWPAGRRPDQLPAELDWIVGCTYTGQPRERADVRNLMGCNMSFRSAALARIGGFDEAAGRIGTIPLGCEETELCIRLTQQVPGARVVFEPRAVVHHRVSAPRVTWRYLRERSLAEGLSKAAMSSLVGAGEATSTERDYVRRVLTSGVRRELGRGLRGHASGWRAASGIVVALATTTLGYARGRLGLRGGIARAAEARRGTPA